MQHSRASLPFSLGDHVKYNDQYDIYIDKQLMSSNRKLICDFMITYQLMKQ